MLIAQTIGWPHGLGMESVTGRSDFKLIVIVNN